MSKDALIPPTVPELAQQAYTQFPKRDMAFLIARVQDEFERERYRLAVAYFLRLEAAYIRRAANPACVAQGEAQGYLTCEHCQQAVSNHAWRWYWRFCAEHPEWQIPSEAELEPHLTRLLMPQMSLF